MDLILRVILTLSTVYFLYIVFYDRALPLPERLRHAAEAPTAAVVVFEFVRHIYSAPFWDRNATRLVGAFCLKYGFPLYPTATSGPVQSMNYPPLAAIALLPATLAVDPTQALLIADTLTMLYFFLPAFLIIGITSSWKKETVVGTAACLAFVALVLSCPPLAYSGLRIHSDAPALGLAALGAYFLNPGGPAPNSRRMWLSAFCVSLSIWSKQMTIPLVILLPAWILAVRGTRQAFSYLLALAAMGVAMTGLACCFISPSTLFLNLVYISRMPWVGTWGERLFSATREMWIDSFIFLLLAVVFGFGALNPRKSWIQTRWALFAWIGLGMAPLAIVMRGKSGLDVNTLSISVYFTAIAGLVALQEALSNSRAWIRKTAHFSTAGILIGFAVLRGTPLMAWGLSPLIQAVRHNPQQVAYDFARAHPDEVYFPWHPLATLMADKKLYHFEGGLIDWAIVGLPIDQQRFETWIPSHLRWVAYDEDQEFHHKIIARYLPDYSERTQIPELPHWIVYQRPMKSLEK